MANNNNNNNNNFMAHSHIYSWPCRRAFILIVCEKRLLSVKHDQFRMQMRENSKHNNFGFNTLLESSPENIYHLNFV